MDSKHCSGCRDDFYNHRGEELGPCWRIKTAKLVKLRRVRIDEPPPWTRAPESIPDCYTHTDYVFVKPEQKY